MNNAVFAKAMENQRQNRDIRLVTTERRRNYLVTECNFHTTKFFTEKLLAIATKKTEVAMNKPVHLWISILELSKILMYEFWYDPVKPKYNETAKLCFMDTDSVIAYIKTDDIYEEDIAEDVEKRLDTSNFELGKPKGKNKKVIGLMKDKFRWKNHDKIR